MQKDIHQYTTFGHHYSGKYQQHTVSESLRHPDILIQPDRKYMRCFQFRLHIHRLDTNEDTIDEK